MARIIIPIIILFLVDIYAYQGVKTITPDSSPTVKRIARSVYWAASAIIYISILLWATGYSKQLPHGLIVFFLALFFTTFTFKIFMIIPLLIEDLYRIGEWITTLFGRQRAKGEAASGLVSRKTFISQLAVGLGSIPFMSMAYGVMRGAHDYKIHKHTVRLKNLPPAFDGLRIAQISDIHSGSFWSKSAVTKGIDMLLAQNADVIFFTGDLVNDHFHEMEPYKDIFGRIKAPMGVYSILGNHDYGEYTFPKPNREQVRKNAEAVAAVHKEMGWDILMNENRILRRGEEEIALIGIENFGLGFQQYGKLDKAYAGTENLPVKLLLSHDPSHWRYEVIPHYKDIDLVFAGHTHGMQIGIETAGWKWSPIKYRYPEWAGLYQEGEQYLHVNRGFGYLGYPGRLGIRPEISIIELRKA